jgi:hypothetical protein
VNGGDIGMVQRGQHFGFTLEPRKALKMGRERFGQNLQRNVAFQARVASTIDFTL